MVDTPRGADEHTRPIAIADGVWWVGFRDVESGLHCNPYLIVDGDEAVVIDGGSRPDYPTVMMKILQAGVKPSSIRSLIYQHYDPDLCGSVANFEDIIDRDDLTILSEKHNAMFIRHYAVKSQLVSLERLDYTYTFSSGRRLRFFVTPYAHSEGSFVTFDEKSGVLFSSDLFGSYSRAWTLHLALNPYCADCEDYTVCRAENVICPIPDMLKFHQSIMTSTKALRHALRIIAAVPFTMIAPQHGSVIGGADARIVIDKLMKIDRVGIDRFVDDAGCGDVT